MFRQCKVALCNFILGILCCSLCSFSVPESGLGSAYCDLLKVCLWKVIRHVNELTSVGHRLANDAGWILSFWTCQQGLLGCFSPPLPQLSCFQTRTDTSTRHYHGDGVSVWKQMRLSRVSPCPLMMIKKLLISSVCVDMLCPFCTDVFCNHSICEAMPHSNRDYRICYWK